MDSPNTKEKVLGKGKSKHYSINILLNPMPGENIPSDELKSTPQQSGSQYTIYLTFSVDVAGNTVVYLDPRGNEIPASCILCQISTSQSWFMFFDSQLLCEPCAEIAADQNSMTIISCKNCKTSKEHLIQPAYLPCTHFLCVKCNVNVKGNIKSKVCVICSSSEALPSNSSEACRNCIELRSLPSITSLMEDLDSSLSSDQYFDPYFTRFRFPIEDQSSLFPRLYGSEPCISSNQKLPISSYRYSIPATENIQAARPSLEELKNVSTADNSLYDAPPSVSSRQTDSITQVGEKLCNICEKSTTNRWVRERQSAGQMCYNCYQKRNRSGSFVDVLPDGSSRQRTCTSCLCTTSSRWHKDRDKGNLASDLLFKCNACYRRAKQKASKKSEGRQFEQADGRQRLHGAFKGGFSAGYYNTVGSEAGFQPQKFKSNRIEKGTFSQQKLDFMDEEDIQEFGANEFKADNQFAELGSTERELSRKRMLKAAAEGGYEVEQEIIETVDNKIGEKLMRMMGHVPGSAIGKQKGRDEASIAGSALLSLKRPKASVFGLGYDPTANAPEFKSHIDTTLPERKDQPNRGGFGIGVFEDNDDMDEYDAPKVSYSTVLDDEDDYSNPFKKKEDIIEMEKTQEPILVKSSKRKGGVIEGFVAVSQLPTPAKIFLAPIPPPGYKSLPSFLNPKFQNVKDISQASDSNPKQLGKNESIFSFISLKNKERLDSFISKASTISTPIPVPKAPLPVYTVPTKVAEAALKGFMPFGSDLEKQNRYKNFLQKIIDSSKLEVVPEQKNLNDDEAHETREFSKAAMIFRPLSDMIASRFTNETGKEKEVAKELPPVKIVRYTSTWKPSALLCRRYAVAHVSDNSGKDRATLAESKQPLNPESMKILAMERDKLIQRGEINMDMEVTAPTELLTKEDMMNEFMAEKDGGFEEIIEEKVEEKPSIELFKAIFADSSDSDSEDNMELESKQVAFDQPLVTIAPIAAPKPALVQPALVIVPPTIAKQPSKSILKNTGLIESTPKLQIDSQIFFKAKSALKAKKTKTEVPPADEVESEFKPIFSKRNAAPAASVIKSEKATKRVGSAFGLSVRKKKQKAIAVVAYSDEED